MVATKRELAELIHARLGISQNLSEEVVSNLFNVLADLIKEERVFKAKNLGVFTVREKPERFGFDIGKNIPSLVLKRSSLSFIPSKNLKNKINNG